MNLQQLRVLVAVIDHRSFTVAARELAMTQPAVSQHIRSLERYCRFPLVERSPGQVDPTAAGLALYRLALRILQVHDEAERLVAELRTCPCSVRAGVLGVPPKSPRPGRGRGHSRARRAV